VAGIILHHYGISLFSERVRLALGLKDVPWRSVDIPAMMPKPDLLPLTGGYRRTPVMQIGADIYCDTLLILAELERRHPEPSLYPENSQGIAKAISWWADKSIFPPSLGVLAAMVGRDIPKDFVAERKAFGFPLDADEADAMLHRHLQQGSAHFGWLSEMLADGRPFLLGSRPSAADLAAYCPLWLLKTRVGAKAEAMLRLTPLNDWYDRVTAIGHGTPEAMTAADALALAYETKPDDLADAKGTDPSGLQIGSEVIVTPDDTGRDPVRGRLLAAGAQHLTLRYEHPRVGEVNIHFPRAGFDVTPA
jgi:glutathione S-transferase